jgi:putative holliday junction resolvase
MNYLGIDYGRSKIGLATAKEGIKIAMPFDIVSNIDEIGKVIIEEKIDEIVVGYPFTLSGEIGPQAKEVDNFIEELNRFGKKINKQDERFSTRSSVSKKQEHDDSSSAALILQTYLERI